MLYCSNLRGSTISPSGVPLFHHPSSTVPPSDVTLLHHQMFYCSSNRCSTFPPIDLSLSHHFCFTVPPSAVQDVKVFYHQVFYCFSAPAVGFFTVPPWDVLLFTIRCSTVFVLLLHHPMFYFFTMRCSIVPPLDVSLVHHDCSTVSPSDVLLSHHVCFTVRPSDCLLFQYCYVLEYPAGATEEKREQITIHCVLD